MLPTALIAEKVSDRLVALDNGTNFVVYETSNLDVIYRWGNSKNTFVGFQYSLRDHICKRPGFNIKLKNHNSRTCEIFTRRQYLWLENGLKYSSFF